MAGLFGFFDFEKPGRGIGKDDPEKNRFFLFFDYLFLRFWKLAALNLLYIIACLPVITIGPATAGFTLVLRNFAQNRHSYVWSDFWNAFKKNWRQSLFVSIINFIAALMLYNAIEFYILTNRMGPLGYLPVGLGLFFVLCYFFMQYYIYIMIVTFDFNLRQLYKNALILALAGLRTNIITSFWLVFIWTSLFYLFFTPFTPLVIIFVITFAFSLSGFIIVFNSFPHIKKHIIDPYYAEHGNQETKDITRSIFTDMGKEKKKKSNKKVKGGK